MIHVSLITQQGGRHAARWEKPRTEEYSGSHIRKHRMVLTIAMQRTAHGGLYGCEASIGDHGHEVNSSSHRSSKLGEQPACAGEAAGAIPACGSALKRECLAFQQRGEDSPGTDDTEVITAGALDLEPLRQRQSGQVSAVGHSRGGWGEVKPLPDPGSSPGRFTSYIVFASTLSFEGRRALTNGDTLAAPSASVCGATATNAVGSGLLGSAPAGGFSWEVA